MHSVPALLTYVNGWDKKPASPTMDPLDVMRKGQPSYCGGLSTGSLDNRTFRARNAFCCFGPHLSFSDAALRALLYTPFLAFPLACLGMSIFTLQVRSVRDWAIHV